MSILQNIYVYGDNSCSLQVMSCFSLCIVYLYKLYIPVIGHNSDGKTNSTTKTVFL